MKRNYPWQMFVLGVCLNFLIRNFLLFLAGIVLCILGIWFRTCLYMGVAVLILDLILSVIQQIEIRQEVLAESDNPEFNEVMDAFYGSDEEAFKAALEQEEQALAERQAILQKLVVYRTLRGSITEDMTLEQMVDAFEKMCEISVGEPDDLLFETGTYDFTGEKLFYFSLVRQFQFLDQDEYVQLHLDVLYQPSHKTALLRRATWGSLTEGNFFDMVRGSRAFQTVRELPILRVDVRVEET